MQRRRATALIAGSLLLAAACFAGGCGPAQEGQGQGEPSSGQSCIPVSTAEVRSRSLKETVSGIGSLQPYRQARIRPEVAGIVEEVHFREGEKVEKGDLLFSLDDDRFRDRLRARRAALQEAQAQLENAERTYRRRQKLFERSLGTEEARDEAETALQAARAKTGRLKAEIAEIREILEDTRIRAPFSGYIGERKVDPGNWVDVGTALVELVRIDRLKLSFTIPERYTGRAREGQKVAIRSQAYPDRTFSGSVYFVSPSIRQNTRDLLIKAHVDNSERRLKPGGFASVELTVGTRQEVPVLPEEALIATRSGYMVFVVENSRARARDVRIGLRRPGRVEIRKGLKPGQTVVRTGHISVTEGAKVCPEGQG
jgi:membrane fusion protein (multidrug efflux system)